MADALIGHSGFVGSTLQRQRGFDRLYRAADVHTLAGQSCDLVVCAGAPAQKWLANREPEADRQGLQRLRQALQGLRCRQFVLVSTVDVFVSPQGVDEAAPAPLDGLHPYGRHRRELECFVQEHFDGALIVRLPALVGPGLRKNALHDLHHGHETHKLDSRAAFQFYPMVNLWADVQQALRLQLGLVHFAAEPVRLADIAREALGRDFEQVPPGAVEPARYDFRSRHAAAFGGRDGYLYGRREVMGAVRAYAQSEPVG